MGKVRVPRDGSIISGEKSGKRMMRGGRYVRTISGLDDGDPIRETSG